MYYKAENETDAILLSSRRDLQAYTEMMLAKLKELAVERTELWLLANKSYTVSKLIHSDDLMRFKFKMEERMFNGTHLFGCMLDEQVEDFIHYDVKKIAIGCIMDFLAEQFGEDFL